jgi:hypothetical protein
MARRRSPSTGSSRRSSGLALWASRRAGSRITCWWSGAETRERRSRLKRPLVAWAVAVAAYVKTHSYGEYIFDWAWARAAEQAGLAYYPKLVVAVPMTPATGPRLLVARDMSRGPVVEQLVAGVQALAERRGCRSIHWLFTTAAEQAELQDARVHAAGELSVPLAPRGRARLRGVPGAHDVAAAQADPQGARARARGGRRRGVGAGGAELGGRRCRDDRPVLPADDASITTATTTCSRGSSMRSWR